MPGLNGSLIWFELMTADAARAEAFYGPVLGWTFAGEGEGRSGYRMISAADGPAGGMLPLTRDMIDHGARPMWLIYVGVDDVDGAAAAIEEAGGSIQMPPFDIPGIGRIAMVADPQGALFYVMSPIPPEGGGENHVFSPDLVGHCTWNELQAADLPAALAFYHARFGWEVSGSIPMGEGNDYLFLSRDGVPIGAAMAGASPRWRLNFRVADIAAALAAVPAAGGQILHGPDTVPGGQQVAIVTDPDGVQIGLVAR